MICLVGGGVVPGNWAHLAVSSKIGLSSYPQQNLSAKLLTPKYISRWTLVILTNRSHQVDLRSLRSPCFVFKSLCKMKLGDQCLTCTSVISLSVLGGQCFGLGDTPGSSVFWIFKGRDGPWRGLTQRANFSRRLRESYQMDSHDWEEKGI